MYFSLIFSSILVLIGATLSLCKDLYIISKEGKPKKENFFPIAAFVLGLSGVILSFNNSRSNIDERVKSDSALEASKRINDSLINREINLLGGGTVQPQFYFAQLNPTDFIFMIRDSSRFPVRDVTVSIRDEEALQSYKAKLNYSIKDTALQKAALTTAFLTGSDFDQISSIPYLTYESIRTLKKVTIATGRTTFNYTVNIDWTSGSLAYYIKGYKGAHGWKESLKRYDRTSGITTVQ